MKIAQDAVEDIEGNMDTTSFCQFPLECKFSNTDTTNFVASPKRKGHRKKLNFNTPAKEISIQNRFDSLTIEEAKISENEISENQGEESVRKNVIPPIMLKYVPPL
ncbi:hypothetical protein AVEN_170260-1 [Araneus ventricosus]|uniref:Uncharacterized protein n=1 Tax=Araneus ventricosus TaxID=182803 RepID=A0A4Y2H937_ARAVE|nr:hypothetical protein AVEN_170260-1 [Araneus ventricosus]